MYLIKQSFIDLDCSVNIADIHIIVYKSPAIYEMRAWIDYQVEIDAQYYWAIHKEGYNSFRLREGEIIERDLVLTESDSIKKIYQ